MLTQSIVLALAASAMAAPYTTPYTLHEKRTSKLQGRTTRVSSDAIVPVRIGLTQSNLDNAYNHLMDVSDPFSSNYGKHWTHDEVSTMFAPSQRTHNAVKEWLVSAGVDPASIVTSDNQGWLAMNLPVHQAESLFKTEYFEHENPQDGTVRLGCDSYHLPSHLVEHVDFIKPGVSLSAPVKKRTLKKKSSPKRRSAPVARGPYKPGHGLHNGFASNSTSRSNSTGPDLSTCGRLMTPTCIRALYDIPDTSGFQADSSNALGVFELTDVYAQEALDLFFKNFAPNVPQGTHPIPILLEGTIAPVSLNSSLNMGESDIDLTLAFSLIYPQQVILYQSGDFTTLDMDTKTDTIISLFLDAIDGSYCTSHDRKGGAQCGTANLARVVSVSYGNQELDFSLGTAAAQQRACNEIAKLGLQGTTVVVSSGDYGVATNPPDGSNGCAVLTTKGIDLSSPEGDLFMPSFPASCPFVLAVGATQLKPDQTLADAESVMELPAGTVDLRGVNTTFGSSGGFSNFFDTPDWQLSAVNEYFTQHDPGYPYYQAVNGTGIGANGGIYNRGGRGIPDVSANGAYLASFAQGQLNREYGTSLSAPIWGSLITLINEKRCEAGKGPVGYINPTLYANPHAFTDITIGQNPGCHTQGFTAVPGWDPLTGLGTPDFPSLLNIFLSLP